jgi:Asp-tRNA(Asn)/Glu-tRNA(Gln) amidotransferase A subunit family amidase
LLFIIRGVKEANRLGAKEAARLIERGELTASALLRSCFERVAAREADVKAWAWLDEKQAFSQLESVGAPLRGIPVGVKDIFDTHDMPTAYGSPVYEGHRPRTDAAAVALTRRAGGVVMGKTVTAEFATFVPRETRNPHDLSRTPGGSSSGSAAAVADFMVPLAFGTQTAGSQIRPGSYCGIVSFKPTFNTIARAGVKPGADSLDTIGLFGRSVEDVAFFAAALTDRRELEAKIERAPRVAMCRTYEWGRVQPEMRDAFEDAGRRLGAPELELPARFKDLRESHTAVLWYEIARSLADEFARFPERMDPALRQRCADGFALDPEQYVRALRHARECRAHFAQALGEYDVLLAPAATGEAPKGLSSTGDVAMNVVWTLLHVPCVAVPVAKAPSGMPLGLQVIGRIGDDARTLACAARIAQKLGAHA